MHKNLLVALSMVLFSTMAYSQNFNWEASLPPVTKNEFYNILLDPEITTHLKQDLSDIRIYSSDEKEIPYILKSETSSSSTIFKEYSILENRSTPNCCTHLILQNASKNKINNIRLIIKNSDVRKKARLSGSDDNTNWYIIKDDYHLESVFNSQNTSEVKILNFPLSDYEYYKLEINDSSNAPVKILKAGYYDTQYEETKYLTLPAPVIEQKDSSDKVSYIKISFKEPHFIHRIKIDITSPEYFLRKVRICKLAISNNTRYFKTIQSDELRSNHENILLLDYVFARELYLLVENNDNQPLEIKAITGYQLIHYLTAKLEQGKNYRLRFGNEKMSYPQYDLHFFKDSIPASVHVLNAGKAVNIGKKAETLKKDRFFTSTVWIWSAILIVCSLLAYMSYKMLKEIKKE